MMVAHVNSVVAVIVVAVFFSLSLSLALTGARARSSLMLEDTQIQPTAVGN